MPAMLLWLHAPGWWAGCSVSGAVFLLVPCFAGLAAAIDLRKARGAPPQDKPDDERGLKALIECRPLVIFAGCLMLFHFANAPLLPLVGQKLAAANPTLATAMMSFCVIAAQLVMLPVAIISGRRADRWGRKPILLAAFGILPIRAVLYTLSDNREWLNGVQVLDGIDAGILGTLTPLVVADLMRGTERYNLAQGAVAIVQGIGASLSGLAAGVLVDRSGYGAAFLAAGAAAAVALVVCLTVIPETMPRREDWRSCARS